MEDVTSTEFHTFMGILFSLSIYAPKPECANNIIELLAMIERQADFAAKFDVFRIFNLIANTCSQRTPSNLIECCLAWKKGQDLPNKIVLLS